MRIYKNLIRPLLFAIPHKDVKQAHHLTLKLLPHLAIPSLKGLVEKRTKVGGLEREIFGIRFLNPVGLAAGFDKNAEAMHGLSSLGFGFLEIGTVVPLPQAGNSHPRLFRLERDESIINRMGFNSRGVAYVANRLVQFGKPSVPLFINVGMNKNTPPERAADDYITCILQLYPYADVFVINVSSPNTPGLRDLQRREILLELVSAIQEKLLRLGRADRREIPLVVKIAPDLSDQEFDDVLYVVDRCKIDGLTISNTTLARPPELRSQYKNETGGLSGPLLFPGMIQRITRAHKALPKVPLIASGGINTPKRAQEAFAAGASLIQIYTGLIYEGPGLPSHINRYLARKT